MYAFGVKAHYLRGCMHLSGAPGRAGSYGGGTILLACLMASGLCAAAPSTPDARPVTIGCNAPVPPADSGNPTEGATATAAGVNPAILGCWKAAQSLKPAGIAGLSDSTGHVGPVGLNEELLVRLAPTSPATSIPKLDASRYALFFNGREVKDLPDANYDPARQSLVFELRRDSVNKDLWTSLLGSPSPLEFTRAVTVSLGERPSDSKQAALATIAGVSERADKLQLKVLPPGRFAVAIALIATILWLVIARTATSTTLRDSLLPQIAPKLQTYSLARCQMAFWFVLIFCSFVFLYVITWDFNTISQQALALMGISGATALAAVAVDVAKDSPADAVNRGLRALGLNSYEDVLRIQTERADRLSTLAAAQQQLSALPPPPPRPAQPTAEWAALNQRVVQLQIEVQDRNTVLRTYHDRVGLFITQGWFTDITTDQNGTAIHRLQVFCWTAILGGVFLIGVYRNLAMPEFSNTLLALLGISGAGYVGFKYPEKNN
jgi:hypothetical protein